MAVLSSDRSAGNEKKFSSVGELPLANRPSALLLLLKDDGVTAAVEEEVGVVEV